MEFFIGLGLLAASLALFAIAMTVSEERSSRMTLFFVKSEFTALIVTIMAAFGVALVSTGASSSGLVYEGAAVIVTLLLVTLLTLRRPRSRRAAMPSGHAVA